MRSAERRQAAGDERLAQSLGRERQVASRRRSRRSSARARSSARRRARGGSTPRRARSSRRESASGTRPAAPAVRPGSVPTGVERPVPRWSSSSTRKSCSARSSQPGRSGGASAAPPRAGPALQEEQQRPVEAVEVGDLAREDRDLLAVGPRVVERDRELVLGEHQPVDRARDRHEHRAELTSPSASRTSMDTAVCCKKDRIDREAERLGRKLKESPARADTRTVSWRRTQTHRAVDLWTRRKPSTTGSLLACEDGVALETHE